MGIFLNFTICPERIPDHRWEEVYEEALRMVEPCDLLDCICLERNGLKYAAARKTEERVLSEGGLGICICGTMDSGFDMEQFELFRRKPRLGGTGKPDNGADILFFDCSGSEEPDFPEPTGTYTLWSDKTQGRPGHIPLLAIACLFADRFPDAVSIGGDITAGQCRAAVKLANQSLERPIQTPVTCRAEALALRLRGLDIPAQKQLAAFFRFFLDKLTPETGQILNRVFPEGALYQYFRARAAEGETAGLRDTLRDYLLLRLDPPALFRMLVQDPAGPRLALEKALSLLFDWQVHIPVGDKNCVDPLALDAAVDGDAESPHEIEALMGRAFFSMLAGRNRSLPVYLPLGTIRAACRQTFPGGDTDALIDRLLAELVPDERQQKVYGSDGGSLLNRMYQQAEDQLKQAAAYDLNEPQDLRRWRPGLTIAPGLEETLLQMMRKIRTFSTEHDFSEFLALDRAERENYFIRLNRYVLIYETSWDYIFSRVMDNDYIERFFLLFRVDCCYKTVHDLVSALLRNHSLIDMLWEQTSEASAAAADD